VNNHGRVNSAQDSDDNEIPDLCKKTFVSISRAVTCLWVVGIVIIAPATAYGIKWAVEMDRKQSEQAYKIQNIEKTYEEVKALGPKLDEVLNVVKERRY
jgi:hypothetical protein